MDKELKRLRQGINKEECLHYSKSGWLWASKTYPMTEYEVVACDFDKNGKDEVWAYFETKEFYLPLGFPPTAAKTYSYPSFIEIDTDGNKEPDLFYKYDKETGKYTGWRLLQRT